LLVLDAGAWNNRKEERERERESGYRNAGFFPSTVRPGAMGAGAALSAARLRKESCEMNLGFGRKERLGVLIYRYSLLAVGCKCKAPIDWAHIWPRRGTELPAQAQVAAWARPRAGARELALLGRAKQALLGR
jgi:hypothetical protein